MSFFKVLVKGHFYLKKGGFYNRVQYCGQGVRKEERKARVRKLPEGGQEKRGKKGKKVKSVGKKSGGGRNFSVCTITYLKHISMPALLVYF